MVGRGAAYTDYDLDGDLDVLVSTNNGPPRLFRNNSTVNHAVRMIPRGVSSNRDAIGARVVVTHGDDSSQSRPVKTGSSYLSQSEVPATFGVGSTGAIRAIEVHFPRGGVEKLGTVESDQTLVIEQGNGIVQRTPLRPRGKPPRDQQ